MQQQENRKPRFLTKKGYVSEDALSEESISWRLPMPRETREEDFPQNFREHSELSKKLNLLHLVLEKGYTDALNDQGLTELSRKFITQFQNASKDEIQNEFDETLRKIELIKFSF